MYSIKKKIYIFFDIIFYIIYVNEFTQRGKAFYEDILLQEVRVHIYYNLLYILYMEHSMSMHVKDKIALN